MIPILPGATSQSVYIKAIDNTTGLAATTLTSATAALVISYQNTQTGTVTAITLSDLAASNSAWSSGGMKHIAGGVYRLCIPDAAVPATEGARTIISGTATAFQILGCELVGKPVELGGTAQTGDSFARIGALGAGLTAVGDTAGTTTLLSRLSSARAGYLDNLSAGAVALQATLSTLATTVSGLAAAVWAYATRTLTQGAASVIAAVTGSGVTVYRGTTWSIPLTGLPSNTGYTAIIFTVKRDTEDADADSVFYVRLNAPDVGSGLIYFEGIASPTAGQASITVVSSTAITIALAAATADDAPLGDFHYGVKYISASGVTQASRGGIFTVAADLPLSIS